MIKTLMTAAIATSIVAASAITIPTEALAYFHSGGGVGRGAGHGIGQGGYRGFGRGGDRGFGRGVGLGILGGAIIGGAIASQDYYDGGYPDTVYEDGYYGCRRTLFTDDYGHQYWRRVCN